MINGGASLPWGGQDFPHNGTTDVNTNQLFSSWEQCLGYAEGQGYPLAVPFPVFVPSELWRPVQARLQTGGHPSHKALEEVFKFA